MTPHWSAEDRCTKPASALRHARRVRCLTQHTLTTPEPRELAGRAARSSSSTCAHHPHATRTRPARRLSFAAQANTSAPRRSDHGAVLRAAALLGKEARRHARLRLSVRGRAETSKRVPPVRPVSYGYATDTTLGRLRYSNQPSSPRRKSIAYTSPNPITYH